MPIENEPLPSDAKPTDAPLSRRDFLRRAGKDAVQTGAALVPGAAVAKVVLGTTGDNGEETSPSLLQRFARWRNNKQSNDINAAAKNETPPDEPDQT